MVAPIVLGVVVLVAWDLIRVAGHGAPALPLLPVAFGLGVVVLLPLVLARTAINAWIAERGRLWFALAGVLDGIILLVLWNNARLRRVLPWGQLVGLLCALGLLWAILRALTARRPELHALGAAVVLPAALFLGWLLPWKTHHFTRFGFDLVALVALSHLLGKVSVLRARAATWAGLGIALIAGIAVEPILRHRPAARRALHHDSIHARGWALPILRLGDGDGDGAAVLLGGVDCDDDDPHVGPGASERVGDNLDSNCEGGDGQLLELPKHPPTGTARGADVLILTIDALRWDMLGEIPRTRGALGAHVDFRRAVSPSARTIDTLSAVLRGRSVRGLRLAGKATRRMPTDDANPTLGALLTAQGYRALTVPTHRYLAEKHNIFAGFEVLEPEGFDHVVKAPYSLGQPKPTVPARRAFARLMAEVKTPEPVVAWVHLMEAHDPYRWSETEHGPRTEAAMRKALRHVDGMVADTIRGWRTARRRPSIVFIFGDHGEEFGEHGGHYHGSTVYAEQVRIGMLLAAPGVDPRAVNAPVTSSAVPATVLDLLGLDAAPSHTAASLVPCAMNRAHCPDLAVSEIRSAVRITVGYTGPRYRLIYDPVHRIEALFDSEKDPFEQRDLAAELPEELARLRARARAWDERH